MTTMTTKWFLLAALAITVSGCEKASGNILMDWQNAGLTTEGFAAAQEPLGDGECIAGKVSGIHTVLCSYADEAAAAAMQDAALGRVGETTGAALVDGKRVLVVADRDGVDRSGKTLNTIAKVFLRDPSNDPAGAPAAGATAARGESAADPATASKTAGPDRL